MQVKRGKDKLFADFSTLTELCKPNKILIMPKMSKSQLRKTAYEYIKGQIGNLNELCYSTNQPTIMPLSDLMLLKEGLADPSDALVILLKQLLRGSIAEVEIDTHLVVPFQQRKI
ncbi:hypothetical protein ACFLXJ_00910 [Chloroflexota bacterium]